MMKKIKRLLIIIFVISFLFIFTGCKGDESLPRKYQVNFVTNTSKVTIPSVVVHEGYHITGTTIDLNTMADYAPDFGIFKGWYSDEEFTESWDVDAYRVSENMTLYAKWSYYQKEPTEIATSNDAFSTTLNWIQDKVDNTTVFEVKLLKATVKEMQVADLDADPTGKTLKKVEVAVYPPSGEVVVQGTPFVSNYNVTYKINEQIAGGIYRVIITSTTNGSSFTSSVDGIYFKGTGTEIDPYLIYNEADLRYLTTHSFGEGTHAILKNDISLHSVYNEKIGCVYDGVFNGNGKTITLKNNSGLFYELGEHAEVYGIKFSGAISGSDPSIGVVANYNAGYIHNVESLSISVSSHGGKANDLSTLNLGGVGGIVGTNKATGRITLCTITSGQANIINGYIGVGGIAGINYGKIYDFNSTVTPCSAIIGAYNGKELATTLTISYAGCAVGVNFGSVTRVNVDGKINCRRIDLDSNYVTGSSNIGGVVGYNAKGATIDECLFQGMRCVGDTNVGGIVGYNDGLVQNCFTGRRIRKPSGTIISERMFISPVSGTYNVGGICGKCGENSVITNCFSTANVWAYGEAGYTIAEKCNNCIGVKVNQNPRLATTYLGRTYGIAYTNDLVAPIGVNNIILDNSERIGSVEHNLLGANFVDGKNVMDTAKTIEYLHLLGDKFGYNNTYGISLLWQSVNTHPVSYYEGE